VDNGLYTPPWLIYDLRRKIIKEFIGLPDSWRIQWGTGINCPQIEPGRRANNPLELDLFKDLELLLS